MDDELHGLPRRPLPGDDPQDAADLVHAAPVADGAMDVADDPAGKRRLRNSER